MNEISDISPDYKRYFLVLAYRGTRYCGWQIQPNAPSVQQTLEEALSVVLRVKTSVTGCGRTDTGVHASYYTAHFDSREELPPTFVNGLNSLLPDDIAIYTCTEVHPNAHARFDAFERSYAYHITFRKDPFLNDRAWFYPQYRQLDMDKMEKIAGFLTKFGDFKPFCKSNSGLDHYQCDLREARWEYLPDNTGLVFHISANRFLRGMVRLVVGACIQGGKGQLAAEEVYGALEKQRPLAKNLSVPAHGLFLTAVRYPYLNL
jgi:tRNA pseudouridine38-40 synthase